MVQDILKSFSSRKFLAAVVAGVIGVLAAVDVINPSEQQAIIAQVTPLVYILVEGVIDYASR